jgi:hypothetical protein
MSMDVPEVLAANIAAARALREAGGWGGSLMRTSMVVCDLDAILSNIATC